MVSQKVIFLQRKDLRSLLRTYLANIAPPKFHGIITISWRLDH